MAMIDVQQWCDQHDKSVIVYVDARSVTITNFNSESIPDHGWNWDDEHIFVTLPTLDEAWKEFLSQLKT